MTHRKDVDMIYTLKFEGKKYAYDTASGAVVPLASLPFKMVEALEGPLEPLCPTSLRYELAKYDSMDVSEAYDAILEYAENDLLYVHDDGVIRLMSDGEYAPIGDRLATELLTLAFAACDKDICFVALGDNVDAMKALANTVATGMNKRLI